MVRVLCVIGTRPEAIKRVPVVREMRRRVGGAGSAAEVEVCLTAQHREMLDQVLQLFEIQAEYDLDVMTENQTQSQVAAAVLERLEPILQHLAAPWARMPSGLGDR